MGFIDRCPDCPYRGGPAIGTRGNSASPLILVGEAPGANEVDEGQPFVRQPRHAGGVLWDALDVDIERPRRAVIVTLGATAFRAVTERRGFRMRDVRGQPVESRWGTLIPTIHPASVLHQPRERPMLIEMLVEHLQYARHLALGPEEIGRSR